MNGYICMYRGKRVEVYANTTYAAQCEAAKVLKVKPNRQHEITVGLAEKGGSQVSHIATE